MPAITLRPTVFLPLLCLTGLLTGCGNSDNDPETAAPETPLAAGALQPVTDAQLAVYLQQALGATSVIGCSVSHCCTELSRPSCSRSSSFQWGLGRNRQSTTRSASLGTPFG